MDLVAPAALTELVLSSTSPSSPLPTTLLHQLSTASLLLSFKHPPSSTSTTAQAAASSSLEELQRRHLVHVPPRGGESGLVLGLGGKEGRAALSVWGLHKEQSLQRVVPPVRLSVIAASSAGTYLAGGTPDGRILIWDLASGVLLAALDAHYRSVTVLEFSADEACLVSGSDDAGVSVWSLGSLLTSTLPTPYATVTDHTLPITAAWLSTGVFPRLRLFTASLDSTVKLWDLAVSPPALLSTFSLPSPVTHLAVDPLERFFFVAGKDNVLRRVDLYELATGGTTTLAVGGGGAGDIVQMSDSSTSTYSPNHKITALHLSRHSPTLLLASQSIIHVLALPSLLPTRLIPLPVSSTAPGAITHLSTLLRPPHLGGAGGGAQEAAVLQVREVFSSGGMGRTVANGPEEKGRVVKMRIGQAPDARDLLGISSLSQGVVGGHRRRGIMEDDFASGTTTAMSSTGRDRERELEAEVERLKSQLDKAVGVNERMWKTVVQNAAAGNPGGQSQALRS